MTDTRSNKQPQLCPRCGAVMWPTKEPGGCYCPNATALTYPLPSGTHAARRCDNHGLHPMAAADRKTNHNALWISTFPEAREVSGKWFKITGRNGRWEKVSEKAVRQGAKVEDGAGVVHAFVMWQRKVYAFKPENQNQKVLA